MRKPRYLYQHNPRASTLKICGVEYHRNGVSGDSFHVVRFREGLDKNVKDYHAVVFPKRKQIAVLTAPGEKWDGPAFEEELRCAVLTFEEGRSDAPLSAEECQEILYGKHECLPWTSETTISFPAEQLGCCIICKRRGA